jgi:MFS family permease
VEQRGEQVRDESVRQNLAAAEMAALSNAGEPAPAPPDVVPHLATPGNKLDRRYVTAAMMLVMVLASMEQTVTSTAMPTIIGDLHGLEHYSWVASIYLLACTVSMPLYGRLADALGRKRVVLTAIGLFCIASVLASGSHSMLQLILFRALMGLGAGGIMPVVLTILGDIFTIEERAAIQGFFSAVWGTASLAGPALGAFLVNFIGWRSIFYVNLPFGAIGFLVLAWKYHDHEKPHSVDLDLPGITLLAIACAAVLSLVSRIGPDGWPLPIGITLLIVAFGAAIAFYRVERRANNPVMPPSLVIKRAIGPSLIGSALLGVGFLSLDTYVPLYVQGAKGGGATAAASVVTPVMLAWATSGLVAAPLVVRWGFRKTALLGCLLTLVSFSGLLICAISDSPHWVLTSVLLISGFGFGPASMSYLLAAQDAVMWQQRGIVTSAIQFFRTIGGAVGIGVLGMLFNLLTAPQMRQVRALGANPGALLDPHQRAALPPETLTLASRMFGHGLTWVFACMLLCAGVQMAITLLMPAHKADHAPSRAEAMEAMAG